VGLAIEIPPDSLDSLKCKRISTAVSAASENGEKYSEASKDDLKVNEQEKKTFLM